MTESNVAEGLSLEGDLADLVTAPNPEPPKEAEPLVVPDGEPPADGTVEVSGTKINIGPIVAAERRRVEAKIRAEYEPLKQTAAQVAQLQAELAAVKQQIAPPKAEPAIPEISDTEAETYARRHQLYGADSTLDLKTAKSILSEMRANEQRLIREADSRAEKTAREAVAPIYLSEAKRAAHDNFMAIAATRDTAGKFVFEDPATHQYLLDAWNALPDNLRAVPEVGQVVVKTALGEMALRGVRPRSAAAVVTDREPVLAEPAGNRGQATYTMSAVERKVADGAKISSKDWETTAKRYVPGQPNSLED